MKSKIFAAALLLITTVTNSFGSGNNSNFPVIREVVITSSFQKIVVEKNVRVVLVQHMDKPITITGDEKKVQDIELYVVNDELIITSKNTNTESIVVYVPVKNLSLLKLASGASVSGEGVLKFDNLTVEVNNESQVNLKVIGKLVLKAADGCELVYEKNEISKIGRNF